MDYVKLVHMSFNIATVAHGDQNFKIIPRSIPFVIFLTDIGHRKRSRYRSDAA